MLATPAEPFTPRWVTRVLKILAILYALLFGPIFLVIMTDDESPPDDRAIILMGSGLLLFWVVIGGLIQRRYRERLVQWGRRLPLDWRVRFVLLCILMALLEEVVTTTMTNLGPWLGAESDKAAITASKNYLEVVLLNSVIIFVPMFITWAWMLARWRFQPAEVMLLYGLTGWLGETMTFGPQNIFMIGMWVYVYGLMVWLPAQTVPTERPARRPRWWHWPLAVILPILCAIPFVPVVLLMQKIAGVS